jgi:peptide-methionine (R)-S-oxide reductase
MKMQKTDDEWKNTLTPEQYEVLRKKGTEAPFTGEYESVFDPGTYMCAACGTELFESDKKFEAHCGWPSFYDAKPGAVEFHVDDSLGMSRTEVTCATCGGHLGHVFEGEGFDTPTDQRFCINSVSLKFKTKK